MELELGLEVTRAGKGGIKVKPEVKKVAAGSMAGDGQVHMWDELVAYKVAGGAWHKLGSYGQRQHSCGMPFSCHAH
jgi:hypothetical protein